MCGQKKPRARWQAPTWEDERARLARTARTDAEWWERQRGSLASFPDLLRCAVAQAAHFRLLLAELESARSADAVDPVAVNGRLILPAIEGHQHIIEGGRAVCGCTLPAVVVASSTPAKVERA